MTASEYVTLDDLSHIEKFIIHMAIRESPKNSETFTVNLTIVLNACQNRNTCPFIIALNRDAARMRIHRAAERMQRGGIATIDKIGRLTWIIIQRRDMLELVRATPRALTLEQIEGFVHSRGKRP